MRIYAAMVALLLALPIAAHAEDQAPVGSLTESYVYAYDYTQSYSMMGWGVVPEANLVKHFGLQGDFESLYVRNVYPGQSRLIMAAGPRYTFAPRSRVTPFVFAEGGEMRLATQYSRAVDWNPVAKGGIGLEYKVSHSFALTVIPGEYLGQYQDNGTWSNSFTARAGFTFNLFK